MDLIFSHLSFMVLVYVTARNNVKRYFFVVVSFFC